MKPLTSIITPSEIFANFVRDMLKIETARPRPIPMDVLERRLWDAASFDSYIVGQNSNPLLDELGLANENALEYDAVIRTAKQEYAKAMKGK